MGYVSEKHPFDVYANAAVLQVGGSFGCKCNTSPGKRQKGFHCIDFFLKSFLFTEMLWTPRKRDIPH